MKTTNESEFKITLGELIEDAGYETRSYSPYGTKEYLGVTLDSGQTISGFWGDVLEVASGYEGIPLRRSLELIREAMGATRSDSMGRGEILYWTGIPYTE